MLCLVTGPAAARPPATLGAAVAVVRQMPLPNQQAFAQLALDHLIERFRAELRHTPGKSAGWQRGTGGYLSQLESLRASLEGEVNVRFLGGPRGATRLLVGGRQVMLQTPREAVQGAFEQALLADWCAMTECDNPTASVPATMLAADKATTSGEGRTAALPEVSAAVPVPILLQAGSTEPVAPKPVSPVADARVETVAVAPAHPAGANERAVPRPAPTTAPAVPPPVPRPGTWQTNDDGGQTYASEDGLQCFFGDSRHLKLKQASCAALSRDLRRVVAGLRAQITRGHKIDWAALRLEPRGLGNPVHFSVGTASAGFDAEAPHLAAAPELLVVLGPWLQARARGEMLVGRVEPPEQLAYLEANALPAP